MTISLKRRNQNGMTATLRSYNLQDDFEAIGEFLAEYYRPDNRDGNFLKPAWAYIHGHPWLDETALDRFGVWEDNGRIVGVVHYEHKPGEAFFEITPDRTELKPAMLDHAERYLYGTAEDGRRYLKAWVNDFDTELQALVISRGYAKDDSPARPISRLRIQQPFQPDTSLPDGFRLSSLAEENDLDKLNRVLFRGFDHGEEPPPTDYAAREKQQTMPDYRKNLNIIAVAPDGQYVAYAGTWFVTKNEYAYIEPVCTDPAYRRRGLGRAAVLEGVRRCAALGARIAYVASVQPFYQTMGFTRVLTCQGWIRYLDDPLGRTA